ncbi:MAG TPA: hypothetical protein VNG04_11125 [Candidatus Acidoferrum sp.]|nr:hypothetical protein [Candidatus Acidoferrum sp.]HXJ31081.1 hypothetical protein [Gemmatimonadales bacterium]
MSELEQLLKAQLEALRKRVRELEKRVYGYDHETGEPLPPNRPKPIP